MKHWFLILFGCCVALTLNAQKEILVLHSQGQVQYYAGPNASPQQVHPGMELSAKGRVRCPRGTSAKVLCNGQTELLAGGKTYSLSELLARHQKSSQMGFAARFWSFLTESVHNSDSQEKLEKYHRQYMEKYSGGISGYAQRSFAIQALPLASGKLGSEEAQFSWRPLGNAGTYAFLLTNASGEQTIAQILTRDTFVRLDLSRLALDAGGRYQWIVRAEPAEGQVPVSAAVPFTFLPDAGQAVRSGLSEQAAFRSADPFEQDLMLARQLEVEECFTAANKGYERMLKASPDNQLIKKLYAAFLVRRDMPAEAAALLPATMPNN